MVEDTWFAQEMPVLVYLVERFEDSSVIDLRTEEISGDLDLPVADVGRSLRKLAGATPPYIAVYDPPAEARDPDIVYEVTERARRAVEQWPTAETVADRLVAAFTAAAEQEPDEERRGWLQRAGAWFGGAGRDLAVDIGAAVIARKIDG